MNETRLYKIERRIRTIDLTIVKLNKERKEISIEFNNILQGCI